MKVAVIHDWLTVYAGAEKVLEQIFEIWPEADLFSVVDFLPDDKRHFVKGKHATTTFLQRMPKARTQYRNYLPLMPIAIEQLDLSAYDLVISSSHAVAKGVLTGPDQLHVSYVHSPIRYAWDLQHQYLAESGLVRGIKGFLARAILHYDVSRRFTAVMLRLSTHPSMWPASSCGKKRKIFTLRLRAWCHTRKFR